jgi:hypothetical protein
MMAMCLADEDIDLLLSGFAAERLEIRGTLVVGNERRSSKRLEVSE